MTRRSIDLHGVTDPAWVGYILDHFDAFLQDHANCERKASALALSLVVKHPDRRSMIPTLITLAQEELEHFADLYALLDARGLPLVKDERDPYVNALLAELRSGRETRFIDRMLIASLIECRGAERFRLIAEALTEPDLKSLYDRFWKAEAKHGHLFVDLLLREFEPARVYPRLQELAAREAAIIATLAWRPSLH